MRVAQEKYFVCVWFIACMLNCDSLWLIAVVNYLNHANDLLWSFAPNQTNDTLGRPFGWYLLPLTLISRVVVIYMIFRFMNFSLIGIWVVYHYPENIKHYYFYLNLLLKTIYLHLIVTWPNKHIIKSLNSALQSVADYIDATNIW